MPLGTRRHWDLCRSYKRGARKLLLRSYLLRHGGQGRHAAMGMTRRRFAYVGHAPAELDRRPRPDGRTRLKMKCPVPTVAVMRTVAPPHAPSPSAVCG